MTGIEELILKAIRARLALPAPGPLAGLFVDFPTAWADAGAWALVRPEIARVYNITQDEVDARLGQYVARRHGLVSRPDKALAEVIPSTGLLADYLAFTEGQESPLAFHALAFLSFLGAAIGSQAWVEQRRYRLYPALPVLLVGPSGEVKKGAAIRMARTLVDQAVPKRLAIINKGTERGIMMALRRPPHAITLVAPEFGQTFSKQKHLADIEKFITQLLDHEEYVDVTEMHDAQRLPEGYFFTVLGGSNMPWLRRLPADALTGGFLPRFFIVHRERRRGVYATPAAGKDADRLAAAVQAAVEGCRGEVGKAPEAEAFYGRYYEAHTLTPKPTDDWQNYQNRRHNRVLLVAMLLAVCAGRNRIELDDMRHAALIMDCLDVGVQEVFEELGLTRSGEVRRAVLDMLRRSPEGVPAVLLMKQLTKRFEKRDVEAQLETLHAAGEIAPLRVSFGQKRFVIPKGGEGGDHR